MLKLSKFQRILLINQMKILEALYPDESKEFIDNREILEHGYEYLYDFVYEFITDGAENMSRAECKEVWDTLEMFGSLSSAAKLLNLHISLGEIIFKGYDGNNEGKFMAFARFTVERMERFQYVPMDNMHYWNSHSPMRETYNRMLAVWRKLPNRARFEMSAHDVRMVLDAAVDPEVRLR